MREYSKVIDDRVQNYEFIFNAVCYIWIAIRSLMLGWDSSSNYTLVSYVLNWPIYYEKFTCKGCKLNLSPSPGGELFRLNYC